MCGVESVSDSASEFEYISDAECEPDEGAVSRKRAARADWPQAALTKFARGHELTAAHDISSASSASATSTKLTHLADVGLSDNSHSGSVVSLADVHVEMENLNQAPAVCFAAAESASDDDFASVASSVVSDDDFEALSDVQREPSGEWEML